jgi:hypothetical protein
MGYRKQLSFRTEQLKVMGTYSLKMRMNKIEDEFKRSLQYRIHQAKTAKEKRELVKESNPLFYVFGNECKVFKPYQTYEENYL